MRSVLAAGSGSGCKRLGALIGLKVCKVPRIEHPPHMDLARLAGLGLQLKQPKSG